MLKKKRMIMLPTEEKANWVLCKFRKELWSKFNYDPGYLHQDDETIYKHLYVTSDEEIKKGDWYYDILTNRISNISLIKMSLEEQSSKGVLKIIATTDTSLKIDCSRCNGMGKVGLSREAGGFGLKECYDCKGLCSQSLPQPSESFVKVFVEEYNKGNTIVELMVEYRYLYNGEAIGITDISHLTDPRDISMHEEYLYTKDNIITIKKVKDSWNREEVIKLLDEATDICNFGGMTPDEFNKWIKENL